MRAIALLKQGASPALVDLPIPVPASGEVLVDVRAASLNGFDLSVAVGRLVGMMEHSYPVVLGKDFAGTVSAVGDDVEGLAVGDRVYGVLMQPVLDAGTFAESAAVSAGYGIARLPAGLEMSAAGALGLAGTAALGVLSALDLTAGQTVLVVGATGGVGSILTQYAKAAGARVLATAKRGDEAAFVLAHGADAVIDPTGDVAAQVRELAPEGVDAVAHLAGDPSVLLPLLSAGGRLASTHGFGAEQHPSATAIMANPDTATLDRLAADAAAGVIRVPITRTFTLDEVPDALAAFPAGTLGKLAVAIG
jgi:NADPH:quinone reductase-like Zn-dependent oxidoreductase